LDSKKRWSNSIQRVLQNRTLKVPLSQTWKDISTELGVGNVRPKHLILSVDDHIKLRTYAKDEFGVDLLITKVGGDRLEASLNISSAS
jgi:hypothetical protein